MLRTVAHEPLEWVRLTAAAYAPVAGLGAAVNRVRCPGGGNWRLRGLWQSSGKRVLFCTHKASGRRALIVRGSVTRPLQGAFWIDWIQEDLQILRQVPFSGPPAGCRIAAGALSAHRDIMSMPPPDGGPGFAGFLHSDVWFGPAGKTPRPLYLAGHSSGGAAASLLAAYLYEQAFRPRALASGLIVPVTFAAPTIGNPAFAAYLETLYDGFPYRYVNTLDMVARLWSADGLQWIMDSYADGPRVPEWFRLTTRVVRDWLAGHGIAYAQPGPGIALEGRPGRRGGWFAEVGRQHGADTYVRLCRAVARKPHARRASGCSAGASGAVTPVAAVAAHPAFD